MYKLFCILSIIIFTNCSSETIDIESIEKGENGLTYYKETDVLVTGVVTRKFEDGGLAQKINYTNGKEIGEWYYYTGGERYITGQGESVEIPQDIIDEFPNLNLTNRTLSFGTEDINKPFHYYCNISLYENDVSVTNKELIRLVNKVYLRFKESYSFDEVSIGYESSNEVYYNFRNLPLDFNSYSLDTTDLYLKYRINIY